MSSTTHLFEDGFALLIGVGYCTDQRLSLPGTINDVCALEKVLKDPNQCGYPPRQVSLVMNNNVGVNRASKQGILNGLLWLEERTTPASTVIVYFSGHAKHVSVTDAANPESFYLIPGDCNLGDITGTAISAREFSKALDSISAQKILIILDCCHAGGFDNIKSADLLLPDSFTKFADVNQIYTLLGTGYGRVILLSSGKNQSSWLMEDKKSSIFSYHLLEALYGKASSIGETVITVARIFDYVSEKVPATVKARYGIEKEQIPQINMRSERFVVTLLPKKKEILSYEPETSQTPRDFGSLLDIVSLYTDDLDLREICRAVQIAYNRLAGNSHAERAFSLFDRLEKQNRLPELEKALRKLLPKRFS